MTSPCSGTFVFFGASDDLAYRQVCTAMLDAGEFVHDSATHAPVSRYRRLREARP
jgi:hypothetical protein